MKSRVDPHVKAMLDDAAALPDSRAKEVLLERAAVAAESLGDLESAWFARLGILSSAATHSMPRFESLFMCLAWCFAVSDAEPDRFPAASILWQYKWVATAAPEHASMPRSLLQRIITDLDERFVAAGWGRRAGLHKRVELHQALGEPEIAMQLVEQWRAIPRDRGSDCIACETSALSSLYATVGRYEDAVKVARPIIQGRLSCALVPHSTFGELIEPFLRLGRVAEARSVYERGRRLAATLDEENASISASYMPMSALIDEPRALSALVRARIDEATAIPSDMRRMNYFARLGIACRVAARRGIDTLEFRGAPGVFEGRESGTTDLAERAWAIALHHAALIDQRNQNEHFVRSLALWGEFWSGQSPEPLTGTAGTGR